MALILSGDTGVPASGMPTGSVIQTIQATTSTQTGVASTTFTDIGLSATITPISATSKILIYASVLADVQRSTTTGLGGGIAIIRNSTLVWAPNPNGSSQPYTWYTSGTTELTTMMNLNYLDSPATTSAITYKIQGKITEDNLVIPFDSNVIKDIFNANKDMASASLKLSEKGLLKLEFEGEGITSIYYILRNE